MARREFVLALGAVAIPQARAAVGLLPGAHIDHVALAVGDLDKTMAFYRRLFGTDVLKNERTSRRYLHLGKRYLGIEPAATGTSTRIDHIGIGIKNFDQSATKDVLEKAGFQVREGAGDFVRDPDGTSLQIWTEESWKLNQASPEVSPPQEPLFNARGLYQVSIRVTTLATAIPFYSKLFGDVAPLSKQADQTVFALDQSRIVLDQTTSDRPPGIHYFVVLVDRYDAAAVTKVLNQLGARPELAQDGSQISFSDPDGIRLSVVVAAKK
jgi:catechol 2,3-dioxygenase-like lactoylglutathione lyase family enzyme